MEREGEFGIDVIDDGRSVGDRVRPRKRLEMEPIWRKLEDRLEGPLHKLRNRPGTSIKKRFPQFENRNIGGGVAVGLVEAGVAVILEETVGIPFGSDVDTSGISKRPDGVVYTINVDAPTQNMAEARAFLDSGTGFTSILTDTLKVRDTEVLKTRAIRDTYQVEILVKD